MLEIVFLGTGGGRFATITQKLRTGGIRLLSEGLNLHVDPGPGALVYSLAAGLNPQNLNAILVSHSHIDHMNDVGIFIEAMTDGGTKKRGILAASHSVLYGNNICDKAVSNYHIQLPEKVIEAKVGETFEASNINVKVCRAVHSDPDAVGFRFEGEGFGAFAYMPDSEYFDGMLAYLKGVRLLILSVLRPSGRPWKGHMCTDDAAKIIGEVRPEMAVMTHLGISMIMKGPENEASLIKELTGVPTVAAKDGMKITLNNEIRIGKLNEQAHLGQFS